MKLYTVKLFWCGGLTEEFRDFESRTAAFKWAHEALEYCSRDTGTRDEFTATVCETVLNEDGTCDVNKWFVGKKVATTQIKRRK